MSRYNILTGKASSKEIQIPLFPVSTKITINCDPGKDPSKCFPWILHYPAKDLKDVPSEYLYNTIVSLQSVAATLEKELSKR